MMKQIIDLSSDLKIYKNGVLSYYDTCYNNQHLIPCKILNPTQTTQNINTGIILIHNIYQVSIKFMRIVIFSICYLTTLIGYSSIGSMTFALYKNYGIEQVLLTSGIFVYLGFGTTNAIVIHIIKRLNLKKSLMIGFMGFILYELVIFITLFICDHQISFLNSLPLFLILNSIAGFMIGLSNALVWTINPIYIQMTDPEQNITTKMGLFWSIYMWGTVLAGLINIFVLGYLNLYAYFMAVILFSLLGVFLTSIFVYPFEIQNQSSDQQATFKSIRNQLSNIIEVLTKKFSSIFIYSFMAGLFLSYYIVFINHIVVLSVSKDIEQKELERKTAIVFMCQGIAAILTGLVQKMTKIGSIDKLKYCITYARSLLIGVVLIEFNMLGLILVTNLLDHQPNMYWISIVVMIFWQISEIHIKTLLDSYVKQKYNGSVSCTCPSQQDYSINLFFFSLGSVTSFLLLMIDNLNGSLFGICVIGILTKIAWFTKESKRSSGKQILMEDEQTQIKVIGCNQQEKFDDSL